jgi:uncharacterized metal-binding protein YceD (DUF177 family)
MSTSKSASKLPWSQRVAVSDIPEGGKRFELVADEARRADVAQLAGLRSLPRLQAVFDVSRHGSDGLRVQGEVSATVGQNCVVTLEPLDNEVREEIDLIFAPPREPVPGEGDDDDLDAIDWDEPEPLEGDDIDLGGLAVEFLMLGIDPYPRKPNATFESPAAEDESDHPFAPLAALKKGPDSKE